MATIEYHFANFQLTQENLEVLDKALKDFLRKLFDLNTNTTVRTMFLKKDKGGLGVRKPSLIYTAARIGFLANMLNHSNENIRYVARTENNFLGYAVKENGLLDTNIKSGFGVKSDWPHLNHLTQKVDAKIQWEFPEQRDNYNVNQKCTSHPHC